MTRLSVLPLVAVTAAALVLTGCVPGGDAGPTATPSASATLAPDDPFGPAPAMSFSTTCSALVGEQQLDLIDSTLRIEQDDPSVIAQAWDGYEIQADVMRCYWNSSKRSASDHLHLVVFPDGGAHVDEYISNVVDRQYTHLDTIGDASALSCYNGGARGSSCYAWMTIGEYSVGYRTNDYRAVRVAHDDAIVARAERILGSIGAKLRQVALTPRAWSVPAESYDGSGLCGAGSRAFVRAATERNWKPGGFDFDEFSGPVFERAPIDSCAYFLTEGTSLDQLRLRTLVGGAWMLAPEVVGEWIVDGEQLEIPGAGAAYEVKDYGTWGVQLAYRHSMITVSGGSRAENAEAAELLVAALVAADAA